MKTIFLSLLNRVKINLQEACLVPDSGTGYLDNKFELRPREFLKFSKLDVRSGDERGLVNSLANSKRAIDCQTDEAMIKCGIPSEGFPRYLREFVNIFDVSDRIPIKLRIICSLNLAPGVLASKTREIRNKLEHTYRKPSLIEVN